MTMKRNMIMVIVTVLMVGMAIPVVAQTSFEEYQRQKNAQFQTYKDQKQKDFDAYRREKNARYAEFLRNKWGHFDATPIDTTMLEEPVVPPIVYQEPEPSPAPQPQPEPTPSPILIDKDIIVIPEPTPQPEPIVPIVPEPEPQHKIVSISFYGTNVSVSFPKKDEFAMPALSDRAVADAWECLMTDKYDIVISTALEARKNLNLCDWAYIELLQTVGEKQYGKNTNEAAFMQAYVLVQSGYKLRLAYSEGNRLYALIASQYEIYDRPYFEIDGEKFYPINCNEHSLYISEASFDAEKPMSLQIAKEQLLSYEPSKNRTLTSRRGVTATVCVNKNNIAFYDNYPTACINDDFGTRWAAYANTPMEKTIRETLYPQLEKQIEGKDELGKVNAILNWVQTAFVYKYDDEVWGGDRAFFAAESLYYPYCDCEDRSILFSRIIRDILHLDVVLLYYPGHLATAVHFNDDVNGDYLVVKGNKYIVCDPTYIGAPVGKTMTNMDNKTAKVIVLN